MSIELNRDDLIRIQKSPIFQSISSDHIESVLRELNVSDRFYNAGSLIHGIGDELDFYPVILSGSVQASMIQGGKERTIINIEEGDSFAEAVPNNLRRCPVNIRALEVTHILRIPSKNLDESMGADALIVRHNLQMQMSKKITVLTEALSVLGEPRLCDRVMAYLETLQPDKKGYVVVPYSRDEWASVLRTVDKSLIRELKKMQDDGILEVDGRNIRIL